MLARLRGRRAVGNAVTLILLIPTLALASLACSRLGTIGGPESTPSPLPTPTHTPASTAIDATPSPRPTGPPATPTTLPDGAVRAFTNPDGPDRADYAPDDYPFFEAAHALPTFGQLWFDENQRDIHLALTGDVDGAIEMLGDRVPRGVTLYFHIVEYTQDELCAVVDKLFADREELMRDGIVLTSGGCGSAENRVNVGISPLTPETIAYMQSRYDGPIDYEAAGSAALRSVQPLDVERVRVDAIRATELDLMTCGGRPFPTTALDGTPIALDTEGPEFDALREALDIYVDVYGDLAQLGWILAEKDTFGATFLANRGDTWLEAPVIAGTAGWAPATIDYCTPESLTIVGGSVSVALDRGFPNPGPDTSELHVLVHEADCANGSNPASRLLPPVLSYTDASVTVTVQVRSVGGTCPGNPTLPVTIVLPEPLGDRDLRGVTNRRE